MNKLVWNALKIIIVILIVGGGIYYIINDSIKSGNNCKSICDSFDMKYVSYSGINCLCADANLSIITKANIKR
jgi:hypothetical protein